MSDKKWERPKLIVLVRARDAEAILTYCQGGAMFGGGESAQISCRPPAGFFCSDCQSGSGS